MRICTYDWRRVVPLWYRMHRPICPMRPDSGTHGTHGTRPDAYGTCPAGWGPSGRRFKSGLPDHEESAARRPVWSLPWERSAEATRLVESDLTPPISRFAAARDTTVVCGRGPTADPICAQRRTRDRLSGAWFGRSRPPVQRRHRLKYRDDVGYPRGRSILRAAGPIRTGDPFRSPGFGAVRSDQGRPDAGGPRG